MKVVRLKGWVAGYIAALGSGGIWRSGSGAPDDAAHNNGDYYRDTDTDDLYVKEAGSWVAADFFGGVGGGADGASFLSGVGAPASELGADGDSYVDTSTGTTYLKSGGSWTADGGSLRGPAGADGAASRYVLDLDADALPQTVTAAQHGLGSTVTVTTSDGLAATINGSGDVTITGAVDGSAILTAKPAAPTITTVSGTDTQPTITGTYDASDLVELYVSIDGTTYTTSAAALTAAGGSWSLDLSTAGHTLTAGSYDVVVRQDWSGGALIVASVDGVTVSAPITAQPTYRYGTFVGSNMYPVAYSGSLTLPSSGTWIAKGVMLGGDNDRLLFWAGDATRLHFLRYDSVAAEWKCGVRQADATNVLAVVADADSGFDPAAKADTTLAVIIDGTSLYLQVGTYRSVASTLVGGAAVGVPTDTVMYDRPVGAWRLNGCYALGLLGRALSAAEVNAINSMDDLEGDADLLLLPRTTKWTGEELTTWDDSVGGAGTWGTWGTGTLQPRATEHGSLRHVWVVLQDQSNSRVPNVQATTETRAGTLLMDPDADPAIAPNLYTPAVDWASDVNAAYFDGPEIGMLDQNGAVRHRMMAKVVKGGTSAQEHIDIYFPIVEDLVPYYGIDFSDSVWIYCQGEADAQNSTDAAAYEARLANLIASAKAIGFRKIILGSMPDITDPTYTHVAEVDAFKAAAAAGDADISYVDLSDLATQEDDLHLTYASTATKGQRLRDEVIALGGWDTP